ncbi:glucokinase [Frigoriflavimonas asaccharolytica]|uniref:Glucokinase n=1 Tax=Frigoriflavimonas asaccharolytica TaxID=2735899 RepID=A0A8J8K920_9FLAO|nr:glucokinase [Frigoriflavimonas asaccharolytica]NRS92582.1 glucokinase [Frigoriflavimonas asaccharolytica]
MKNNKRFPLYFPGKDSPRNENISIIAVEVREGKSIVGHYITKDGNVILQVEDKYKTKKFESFGDLIKRFITDYSLQKIDRLAVGFPGPIINGIGFSERISWDINKTTLEQEFGFEVFIINDLEASAYGLVDVTEECLLPIYEGERDPSGNMAILSPGNGLGEAGLFYDGEFLRPFATEGGHTEFSPRTAVEVEFYQFLNKIYGIVSWEQVLSKNGLFNIFRFLRDEKRHPQSEKLKRMLEEGDFVEVVYKAAMEDDDQICTITINTYLEFLAREANNLVLKLKATGGLFIGGDLPMLFKDYIDNERFYQKFRISAKMERVLKNIPIYLVVSEKTILSGVANYGAFYKM